MIPLRYGVGGKYLIEDADQWRPATRREVGCGGDNASSLSPPRPSVFLPARVNSAL